MVLEFSADIFKVLVPEGEEVYCLNSEIAELIKRPFNRNELIKLLNILESSLKINLTDRGFVEASEGSSLNTNYSAIWVRDNMWVFFALTLEPENHPKARALILSIWDYYASNHQLKRFEKIINDPSLKEDMMEVPHIRFNGNSPIYEDMTRDNMIELWNHKQLDAHGLFFLALSEALNKKIITSSDLNVSREKAILYLPIFFEKIEYYSYEEAGAWEEEDKINSSSIGLVCKSLITWKELLDSEFVKRQLNNHDESITKHWSKQNFEKLIDKGIKVVKHQLDAGGESPRYKRTSDAALLTLLLPFPLKELEQKYLALVIKQVESLKREFGIIRYQKDSYQSGNYWIEETIKDPTGDGSNRDALNIRDAAFIEDTEARWFFDSMLGLAYLEMLKFDDQSEYINKAVISLKRALGQMTSAKSIGGDLKPVHSWQLPESINIVIHEGQRYYLPSPICPLNWAKVSLFSLAKKLVPLL